MMLYDIFVFFLKGLFFFMVIMIELISLQNDLVKKKMNMNFWCKQKIIYWEKLCFMIKMNVIQMNFFENGVI